MMIYPSLAAVGFLIIASMQATKSSSTGSKKLYILALAPFPDSLNPPAFNGGFSLIPAVNLAVDHINQHHSILPGYTVQTIIGDSGCEQITKAALSSIPSLESSDKKLVAVIGPSCSESSRYLASLLRSELFNTLQVTFGTTPELDNHTIYDNTFGLIASTRLYATILASLAKCSNWNSVSILYEQRQYFIDTLDVIEETFKAEKINISYIGNIITSPLTIPLLTASHQIQGTRIIIILASSKIARSVSCIASALHFTFPSYQFIYINRKLNDFLSDSDLSLSVQENGDMVKYKCTQANINRGLERAILLRYSLNSTNNLAFTASGKTVGEVKAEYRERVEALCSTENNTNPFDANKKEFRDKVVDYCSTRNQFIEESIFAYPYYDATWAVALSLNSALKTSPDDIHRHTKIQMYNLSFQGISTYVVFDKATGHVSNDVDIFQIKTGNMTRISSNNGFITCQPNMIDIINDSFPIQHESLDAYSIATGAIAIAVLIPTTVLLHILNIVFRKHHRIKATSPLLNHFIFAGCYATILSILLKTIDLTSQNPHLCNASFYLSNLSYDLIFGTLCVKLWRLYNIFKRTFEQQRLLSNSVLATYIVVIILLNGAFHLWMIKYSMDVVPHLTKVISIDNEYIQVVSSTCQFSSFGLTFIPAVLHIFLTFVALVLSMLNKNIKIKEFRGSRRIIILAYLLAILWSLAGTLIIIYTMERNLTYLVYVVASSCTVMLCLILLIFSTTLPTLVHQRRKK